MLLTLLIVHKKALSGIWTFTLVKMNPSSSELISVGKEWWIFIFIFNCLDFRSEPVKMRFSSILKPSRLAESYKQGGAEAITGSDPGYLPFPSWACSLPRWMPLCFSFLCMVYSSLLINEHLSQLKCYSWSKINVCHQVVRLHKSQANKRWA